MAAITSRRIQDLSQFMRGKARAFLNACAIELPPNVRVILTCTWRNDEAQEELYAIGRTKPGKPVTWARAGESKHNAVDSFKRPASKAFDFAIVKNGKLLWDTSGDGLDDNPSDDDRDNLELWQRIGAIGERLGLEWAGRWSKGKREFPHLQEKTR